MAKKISKSKQTETEESGVDDAVLDSLEALDDSGWGDTEESSFDDIPKGDYQVKFEEALIGQAKSSGRLQIAVTMVIQNTKFKGRKLWTYMGLDDEVQRGFTRGTLAKLGIKWPKSAKLLPGIIDEQLVGSYGLVSVSPRKDGDGVNTRIKKALDDEELEEQVEDATDEEDDEEEEVEEKPAKGKKKAAPVEDDEDEDEDDESEESEESDDDDADTDDDGDDESDESDDEDEDDEEPAPKKGKKAAPVEDDEDEDEDDESDDDESDDEESEEEEDDEDDEPAPKGKAAKPPVKPPVKSTSKDQVEVNFGDKDLDDEAKGQIKILARQHKFKATDYTSLSDLLADIADEVGVGGTYDNAKKLIKAIKVKAKA